MATKPKSSSRSITMIDTPTLSAARKAIEKGNASTALRAVLEAWRATRLASLARLATEITAHATKGRKALDETLPPAKYHAAWTALASADDPLDVLSLAPGLLREPLGMSIVERVTQLTSRSADPRIVDALLAMVLEPPATSQGIMGKLYGPVFTSLELSKDSRLVAPLTRYLEQKPGGQSLFWPAHYKRVEKLLAKLPATGPEAEPEVDALIASILKLTQQLSPSTLASEAPKTTNTKGKDILSIVYDDPGSTQARLVVADAFLEKNDPRGKAIQLESAIEAGNASAAAKKQLRALLKEQSDQWVPAKLRPALTPNEYTFRLGFLDSCELITTSLAQQAEVAEHPACSTVRTLLCDEIPLMTSPVFRSLETVGGFTLETLATLGTWPKPLPFKGAGVVVVEELPAKLGTEESWPALPHLRSLVLVHSHRFGSTLFDDSAWELWTWLGRLPVASQLEHLTVLIDPEDSLVDWLDVFRLMPSLRTFTTVEAGQRRWTLIREAQGFALRVGIADSRMNKSASLVDGHHTESVVKRLGKLTKGGVTRLELVDTLGSQNESVKRIAENVGRKNVLPVSFLPGAFPPSSGSYDLINLEVKRRKRFAKANKRRK